MTSFADKIIAWQKQYGRHQLPWQQTDDPYRIWVSEIMLQQTQVETVKTYYARFIARFPNLASLTNASFDEVASLWSGLGYYARARNLHKAAIEIMTSCAGHFPSTSEELERLPGIGRSTAAAISAFAFNTKTTILDGNVKRIFSRYFAIADVIDSTKTTKLLWEVATSLIPDHDIKNYIQGLMDLGSLVCKRNRPLCQLCPVSENCKAYIAGAAEHYPVRKKPKIKPEKTTVFLILRTKDKHILLEKRPNKGIWGGLWCFPSINIDLNTKITDINYTVSEYLGSSMNALTFLPAFQHIFTHFKLLIYPVVYQVESLETIILEHQQYWFLPEEIGQLGVPKPVFDLLEQVGQNGNIKFC